MKRTTIYLDAELEFRLKLEARRNKKSMAELIRETLHKTLPPRPRSKYDGAFDSGHTDTAERAEEILAEGFGLDSLSPEQREAWERSR
jgi:hypothetical protein